MIDIVFLSYDEPNADANYERLLSRFPYAKRVHGVEGIKAAHKAAAKKATTFTFYVVDGDAIIHDDFNFDYKPPEWDKQYVHIYQSLNPVTRDVYGYGGVKIFHKSMFKDMDDVMPLDFSTTCGAGVKYMDQIASTTEFNSDEFHAFRGAYREAFKLTVGGTEESLDRLETWCDTTTYASDAKFAGWVELGAHYGYVDASNRFFKDVGNFEIVNDYSYLNQRFNFLRSIYMENSNANE